MNNENEVTPSVEKYKAALEKAVRAYDAQKTKLAERTAEAEDLRRQNEELTTMVKKYIQEEKPQLDIESVNAVVCHLVVDAVPWVGLKTRNGFEWTREDTFLPLLDEAAKARLTIPEAFDLGDAAAAKKELAAVKASAEQELATVLKQYEGRFKKMQSHLEESEKRIGELTEAHRASNATIEEFKKIINVLVEASEEIREGNLLYVNEDADAGTRTEAMTSVKARLAELQRLSFDGRLAPLVDVKEHLLLLHETLFDALRKLKTSSEELGQQEKSWRQTCDALIAEKEKEKREKLDIVDVGRKKVRELETAFEAYKQEAGKSLREKDQEIEFLRREAKKNVNTQYVKNILQNFFAAPDAKVQEKLLPVLGTVLQFTPDESATLLENWKRNTTSSFSKFLGFGGGKSSSS
eukprot:TRINITY_DN24836_c0_g1_i2.p1 TRINITY_DN24836_c0_g1~~TRINITY_DN24836_c0_g1_i2.p1  ORF type:complete len:409 (+),score=135.18 TRINITY_DN24836_c0_g1_i2:28-1254(+)